MKFLEREEREKEKRERKRGEREREERERIRVEERNRGCVFEACRKVLVESAECRRRGHVNI